MDFLILIFFKKLQSFRLNELKTNFREVQKIYNRKVFSSFKIPMLPYRNSPNKQYGQQQNSQNNNNNNNQDVKCVPKNNTNRRAYSKFFILFILFFSFVNN